MSEGVVTLILPIAWSGIPVELQANTSIATTPNITSTLTSFLPHLALLVTVIAIIGVFMALVRRW